MHTLNKQTRWLVTAAVLVLAGGFAHAEDDNGGFPQAYVVHEAMNADFEFWINGNSKSTDVDYLRGLGDEAFHAVEELDHEINYWVPGSEISQVNRDAANGPAHCSDDLFALLLSCRKTWEETSGAADITVGPLVELWGFYKKQGHFPKPDELRAALDKVGMDKVAFDEQAHTVRFTKPGMRFDLGSVGKGLAIDRAANVLRQHGIKSALLSAGTSSIVAIGAPPGKAGWTAKIRGPYNREDAIDEVLLKDGSLSTSAGYERFFDLEGKKYCHIFDPKTGMPAEGVISVSVLAPTGLQTDSLDTGFFVLGLKGTAEYCKAHPDVRVVVISDNKGRPEPVRFNFQEKKEP